MVAYYNEFDPFAAAWLRELIKENLIASGDVDERPIQEVQVEDIKGFTQCHFFAGIGGWSYALRLAGWPDDRPVWTGSCPCQPFSSAGKQKGKADDRHLWPLWFNIIRESKQSIVFGEQVSSAIRHHWWDDVADDLEREGYTTRAEIRPACSFGAPHKRDRLWFMAQSSINDDCRNASKFSNQNEQSEKKRPRHPCNAQSGCAGTLGNRQHDGSHAGAQRGGDGASIQQFAQGSNGTIQFAGASDTSDVADSIGERSQRHGGYVAEHGAQGRQKPERHHWAGGVWIDCPDGKQRLIESSIRLLADGVPNRVGKLRGYGNAIVPQVAAEFIRAVM